MTRIWIHGAALVMTAAALSGCPKEKPAEPKPNAPKAIAPTPPATPTATKSTTTAGARHMANCPSSVAGASTAVSDIEGGVLVTVTAQGDGPAADIRSRAKHLAEVAIKNPTEIKHDGEGDGGGGLGNCPVVLADTTVTAEDVPGGSKITVKPTKPEDLAKLKQVARERASKLAAPQQ
jgi:hypothetical protein